MTWWLIGCSFQPAPLVEYRVGSAVMTPDAFPVDPKAPTVFHAIDGDTSTAWSASAGEVASFALTGPVEFLELDADAGSVDVRTYNGLVGYWEISDWQRISNAAGRRVALAEPWDLVEIRPERDMKIREVRFFGREPDAYETVSRWRLFLPVTGDKGGPSGDGVLVGEVDLERCEAAPDRLPAYTHFRGTCERTESGLRLDGEMNGQRLQHQVRFHRVGPCVALVDGWPMVGCKAPLKPAPAR